MKRVSHIPQSLALLCHRKDNTHDTNAHLFIYIRALLSVGRCVQHMLSNIQQQSHAIVLNAKFTFTLLWIKLTLSVYTILIYSFTVDYIPRLEDTKTLSRTRDRFHREPISTSPQTLFNIALLRKAHCMNEYAIEID